LNNGADSLTSFQESEKMSVFKRGHIYWYKFMWNGELIRESTRQGNDRKARNIESAHRAALANGLVGIREKKAVPSLSDFLKNDFVPFVKTKHAAKSGTVEYYADGANMVCKCDWASEPLDRINDQHAQHFAAKYAALSASRINCGLRSLRRALNLAFEWGKLERPVKITLAKGEKQRDTILTDRRESPDIRRSRLPSGTFTRKQTPSSGHSKCRRRSQCRSPLQGRNKRKQTQTKLPPETPSGSGHTCAVIQSLHPAPCETGV
jgi:hypothetical protein